MILSKLVIAERQLEVAARLYVQGDDYLAIVTLAGAAEEILGSLLRRSGRRSMMDRIIEMDNDANGERPFGVISSEVNTARNVLKHARVASEDSVTIEEGESTAMLARALVNYRLIAGSLSPMMLDAYERIAAELAREAHQ